MLAGKTALVTGSTSGIGLGIALRLAQLGARLMINGFGDAEGALAQVRAHDPKAVYHGADMSRPDQIAEMVRSCESQLGSCDILVNNAGIQHVANVENFPVERWDAIIAINLSSAFHTMHAALPGMKSRNWGRIVNVASVHGLVASAGKSAYVAAKHGVIGLTKAAALENATTGITVNAICPGWVLTPLVQKQVDARAAADGVDDAEAKRRLLAEKQPSLQFTTPEELAELVVFLCSPAAQNVRGVAWNVDGGWTAQ
ncbi:MAG: 3-hydroxybutyrate dehydrogenase [Burkholderiales bacterium]|nr:3-hydroxybutyrate dehydrogenase [Burkholderiales bacterium]